MNHILKSLRFKLNRLILYQRSIQNERGTSDLSTRALEECRKATRIMTEILEAFENRFLRSSKTQASLLGSFATVDYSSGDKTTNNRSQCLFLEGATSVNRRSFHTSYSHYEKSKSPDKDPCRSLEDKCKKPKNDPCKKEDPCQQDPCKKADPCKDPCKKDDSRAKKERSKDPCKREEERKEKKEKEEDPCTKTDPCMKKKKKEEPCPKPAGDPCGNKEDPCKKKKSPSDSSECGKKVKLCEIIDGKSSDNIKNLNILDQSNQKEELEDMKNLNILDQSNQKEELDQEVADDIFKSLNILDQSNQTELDGYFGESYQNKQYFQYQKYSYYDCFEAMAKYRSPQPNPFENNNNNNDKETDECSFDCALCDNDDNDDDCDEEEEDEK